MPEIHRNIPDSAGLNAFRADPAMRRLLEVYLDAETFAALLPHLDRMGGLVGGELEELALTADKNPPELKIRNRIGAEDQRVEKHPAYERLEYYAFGEFGLAAMSHRGGVFDGHREQGAKNHVGGGMAGLRLDLLRRVAVQCIKPFDRRLPCLPHRGKRIA